MTREILKKEVVGTLGHTIKPGDKVYTFTQVYGRGTRVCRGVFLGVGETPHRYNRGVVTTTYVVEREEGRTPSILHYPGMVPVGTTLDELHDKVI
jgi:hypothetical protein